MPRFSVVVPCHRVRAWLRPCLDSVLSQSYGDLELIAVDDASPDDSGAILDEYAAADPRVRVLHLAENVGRGLARNAGLRLCEGDYVLFLDADDTMLPGSLDAIARRISETREPDVVMFDYERAWWDGRLVRNRRHEAFAREGSGVFTAAQRPVFLTFIEVAWNKAYRRSFLDSHALTFTPGYYDDVPWTYATMLTAERIATLDRVVVHFRQRRVSQHSRQRRVARRPGERSRRHFDVLDQYDRVHGFLASDPALEQWRRFVFDRSLDHVLTVLGPPARCRGAVADRRTRSGPRGLRLRGVRRAARGSAGDLRQGDGTGPRSARRLGGAAGPARRGPGRCRVRSRVHAWLLPHPVAGVVSGDRRRFRRRPGEEGRPAGAADAPRHTVHRDRARPGRPAGLAPLRRPGPPLRRLGLQPGRQPVLVPGLGTRLPRVLRVPRVRRAVVRQVAHGNH